jgi:outer membrane lipoprotein SlyB
MAEHDNSTEKPPAISSTDRAIRIGGSLAGASIFGGAVGSAVAGPIGAIVGAITGGALSGSLSIIEAAKYSRKKTGSAQK